MENAIRRLHCIRRNPQTIQDFVNDGVNFIFRQIRMHEKTPVPCNHRRHLRTRLVIKNMTRLAETLGVT